MQNGALFADQCHLSLFQGLSWEPQSEPAPLLVVVVPALPKDAAVEFHVTAVPVDNQSTSWHMTTEVPCGSIDWHMVASADACSTSISLSLDRPVDSLELSTVSVVTEAIGTTFKKAMKKMNGELVPLCARVFYKCTHAVAQLIVEGMSSGTCKMALD